jgi:hypothetical protein
MSGVADNFQLHTLVMDALPADRPRLGRHRRRVSASAAAIARGAGPQQSDETIIGSWNLYTYRALRDGRLPPADDLSAKDSWIWNEGIPPCGFRIAVRARMGPEGFEPSTLIGDGSRHLSDVVRLTVEGLPDMNEQLRCSTST